jgi:rubrerythrin
MYRRDFTHCLLKVFIGTGLLGTLEACYGIPRSSIVGTRVRYPLTISALQDLHADELGTRLTYLAYSDQALSENYPAIAHLFIALAASDSVHLRNFENCLFDLGVEVKGPSVPAIQLLSTRENLKRAMESEFTKIGQYPYYLERIRSEKHRLTIKNIWYAVESEKKHVEHLQKIEKYTGLRFQLLATYLESNPVHYYVCQECGYTVMNLPEKGCPICRRPVSYYQDVKMVGEVSG